MGIFFNERLDGETDKDLAFYTLRNRNFIEDARNDTSFEKRRNRLLLMGWLTNFDVDESTVDALYYMLKKVSYPGRSAGFACPHGE